MPVKGEKVSSAYRGQLLVVPSDGSNLYFYFLIEIEYRGGMIYLLASSLAGQPKHFSDKHTPLKASKRYPSGRVSVGYFIYQVFISHWGENLVFLASNMTEINSLLHDNNSE